MIEVKVTWGDSGRVEFNVAGRASLPELKTLFDICGTIVMRQILGDGAGRPIEQSPREVVGSIKAAGFQVRRADQQ